MTVLPCFAAALLVGMLVAVRPAPTGIPARAAAGRSDVATPIPVFTAVPCARGVPATTGRGDASLQALGTVPIRGGSLA